MGTMVPRSLVNLELAKGSILCSLSGKRMDTSSHKKKNGKKIGDVRNKHGDKHGESSATNLDVVKKDDDSIGFCE